MTMTNGAEQRIGGAVPAWRRCATNVAAAMMLLARPPRIRVAKPWPLPLWQLAIAVTVTAAVLLFGMAFIDAATSKAATTLPRWLISAFDTITDYGKSGWFLWPLGLLFLALAALPPVLPRVAQGVVAAVMVRVGFLFVAIGLPGLFVTVIKRLIGRARPMVTGIADPFVFSPFVWRADYAGMPSGHATTAFSVLVAFGVLWPRARPVLWIYALLILASRVIVTAHYPTDVAAGALVGTVGVLMVRRWFALRRLGFSVGPDGMTRTYPGPSFKRIKSVARGFLAS